MNPANQLIESIDIWVIMKNLLWGFFSFWHIWLPILGFLLLVHLIIFLKDIIFAKIKFKKGKSWRSDQELLQWLRGLTPKEFEEYIAGLFTQHGYKATAVGKANDGGIDVVAEKGGIVNYIQCKKYITTKVPVSAVRDFYGALANRLANGKGYFITTNIFTLEAEKFAEDKPIQLIDGQELVRHIRMTEKNNKNNKNNKQETVNVENKQICPSCGGVLLDRVGKFGPFKGCENYPKCKYTAK